MQQRGFIDYTFQRRAVLRELAEGRRTRDEVCDAQAYLKQAAAYHGDPTDRDCPVCGRHRVDLVHYVFGDRWKIGSGQAKTARQIMEMAPITSEFSVYVVEVCRGCGWNHLLESFVTGIELPPRTRKRRRGPAPPDVAVDLNDL
ncbi:DUF5318 family protein [Blastococcus sp. Marseille-P5729]|uniref:DUF5318 family protein n=1 Tax=Blastococcus sp. Marseille-P5729 TaxID=2086582 RepID=UPI000D0EFA19|nr:DUF5318 family protein [Blastococcus sp. Marseille-P5729]